MTTPVIQWSVTPETVQYQSRPVRLDVSGLTPQASYHLTVETPTDPAYRWEFSSDAAGRVSEDLYLSSGVGRYNFIQAGCATWPAAVISVVTTTPATALPGTGCALEVHINRSSVPQGTKVTVDVTGGAPNTPAILYQHLGNQTGAQPVLLNAAGWGTVEIPLTAPGTYEFRATQGACESQARAVISIGNTNVNAETLAGACDGVIRITPKFAVQQVANDTVASLVLTVHNYSDSPQTVSLSPLVLPSQLVSLFPVALINEPVGARGSRNFYFHLTASNLGDAEAQVTLRIEPRNGSYLCGGGTRDILGGSANLYIAASAKPCGLQIVQCGFTPGTVVSGQASIFSLTVRNIGGAAISDLTLSPIAVPTSLAPGPLEFVGVPLLAGGEYKYSKPLIATSALDLVAVLEIPAGYITATCQGGIVATLSSTTASLSISRE